MKKSTLTISGMGCSGCAASVKEALVVLYGVKSAEVKLDEGTAEVSFDEAQIKVNAFEKAIELAGYAVTGVKA